MIQTESIERYVGEQLPDSLDGIVHLVAKAHVTENEADREEYTRVNVEGTRALLRVAKAKQVKHFVYMSSIKASGEFPESGTLTEREPSSPQGVYGETKWQAEQLLSELSQAGIRVSVVRPPLVYGVGVKANMAALVKLVKWLPALPFGRIRNQRSMISVRNLSNFVMTLLLTPPRAGISARNVHRVRQTKFEYSAVVSLDCTRVIKKGMDVACSCVVFIAVCPFAGHAQALAKINR